MTGVIYQYRINDKYYVGKTYMQERKRIGKHKFEALTLKKDHPFCRAIRKYGWDVALEGYSVIETIEADDKQSLNSILIEREAFWIQERNSIVPNGYNIYASGQNAIPTYSDKEAMYKKVSNALAGKYMNPESTSKPVFCIDEQKWYPSVSEAERQHGGKNGTISKVVSGKNVKAFGLRWSYTEQPIEREDLIKKSRKPVICVETGKIYPSIYDAAKDVFGDEASKKKCRIHSSIKNGWATNSLHYKFLDK